MLKKFVFLLVMTVALSCSFSAMAESYKTPAQLVDDARAAVKQISVEDLERMIDNDEEVIILDIRDPYEYEAEHISGAIHMSRGVLDLHVNEIIPDKNAKIVVY